MARSGSRVSGDVTRLTREIAALRRRLAVIDRRLLQEEEQFRGFAKTSESQDRRQAVVFDALQLGDAPRKGDRGVIRELQDSVVRLEDYLLKTADRIESILSALKQHRELLISVNKRLLDIGTKDRIRLELDVMKNTLSILSLNGVEYDASLIKDIDVLRSKLRQPEDVARLEEAKAELDRKFDGELKKFDLDAIWSKRKEIPGYR